MILITALYNGPITRKYSLESDKIENQITIAVAADLHSQFYGRKKEKIISLLEKAEPDIILMPGDMTNSPDFSAGMVEFMQEAVRIAPCYYVLGNHEYWSNRHEEILEQVASAGVNILRGEMVTLEIEGNIIELYGVDDWAANNWDGAYEKLNWETRLDNLWAENTHNNYRILMTHRPEKVEYYTKYEYDLVVAGHSHGGLVRVPIILNGLYAPDQGWFPKYGGGEYELSDATTMVVSRGLYDYRNMPRVYNPSEIVTITISGNK